MRATNDGKSLKRLVAEERSVKLTLNALFLKIFVDHEFWVYITKLYQEKGRPAQK